MTDPPSVDGDRLSGWERTETAVETVLDVGWFEVTAATVVYEDAGLRARIREATGVDRTWRFFFAARVSVPGPSTSPALHRLVTIRAADGFVDRLTARGFADVTESGRRRLQVGDREAHAVQYAGVCHVDEFVVDVDGWIAVWPDASGGFLLAGGAYPMAVESEPAGDGALSSLFDPETFREDLFALIRATG